MTNLPYGVAALGALVAVAGVAEESVELVALGLLAAVISAFIGRMKGRFRFRADRTGVEIQGTLIEPHEGAETGAREVEAGSTPELGADDERHSGDAQP